MKKSATHAETWSYKNQRGTYLLSVPQPPQIPKVGTPYWSSI